MRVEFLINMFGAEVRSLLQWLSAFSSLAWNLISFGSKEQGLGSLHRLDNAACSESLRALRSGYDNLSWQWI